MKKNLFLAFPLILLSACNGSDSNSDKVAKSTFDAVTAELEQANKAKDELTKKNQELAGQLSTANVTIAGLTGERDASLQKIADLNTSIEAEKQNYLTLKADYDALQIKHQRALSTGKIGPDGKTGFEGDLEKMADALKISEDNLIKMTSERDSAISDRDRLNAALEKLVEKACK